MMIAITGGAGFIGSRLARNFRYQGTAVRIIDTAPGADDGPAIDIRDPTALNAALAGCSEIFHLAAEHRDDVSPARLSYEVNAEGTANLVAAAEQHGVHTIVFSSSVAVHGLDQSEAVETSRPSPFNDYGKSKLQAKEILQAWAARDSSRRLVMLRLTATFGRGNRGNIHRLLKEIHYGRFAVVGSGGNRKSIAYVENVAAFLASCRRLPAGVSIINYADKPDLSMAELVRTVRQVSSRKAQGLRIPLLVGMAGGATLELVRSRDVHAVQVMLGRIRKFAANTIVRADEVDPLGFQRPFSLPEALSSTVATEFGRAG